MEKYGFVYLWYDVYRKMYYLGCHWGTINDGYICSSNRMRDAYRRRPQDFKRRILKTNIDRCDLLEEEFKWLTLISNDELGKKYYNHRKMHHGHWSNNPEAVTSMKERNKGVNNPMFGKIGHNKGKKLSEETKQKIRDKRVKQVFSEETKEKMSLSSIGDKNPFFKKTHSIESKEKMKNWHLGKKLSEETKQKIREARLKTLAEKGQLASR